MDDAKILAEKNKWNSVINRLYYASYYAVSALLLQSDLNSHNGVKTHFSEYFIKTKRIDVKFGKIYSQLFTLRHKGDYDDLFDFSKDQVQPYLEIVSELIRVIEDLVNK